MPFPDSTSVSKCFPFLNTAFLIKQAKYDGKDMVSWDGVPGAPEQRSKL